MHFNLDLFKIKVMLFVGSFKAVTGNFYSRKDSFTMKSRIRKKSVFRQKRCT